MIVGKLMTLPKVLLTLELSSDRIVRAYEKALTRTNEIAKHKKLGHKNG